MSTLRSSRRAAALLLGLLAVGLLAGCATRFKRVPVYDAGGISVMLRSEVKGRTPVDKGYAQPVQISGIRLAHILAAVDVRIRKKKDERGTRVPAVPTEFIYELGDLLSDALTKADSSQHVVVQALRRERRMGVFSQYYLTSFIALVDSRERLQLHVYKVEWMVPKGTDPADLREPRMGQAGQTFRVMPSDRIEVIGDYAVAVDWRAETFRQASNIRVTPTGRVMRRQVLMESAVTAEDGVSEDGAQKEEGALPSSPQALRDLADLEEARNQGRVTEAEYERRRKAILSRD